MIEIKTMDNDDCFTDFAGDDEAKLLGQLEAGIAVLLINISGRKRENFIRLYERFREQTNIASPEIMWALLYSENDGVL